MSELMLMSDNELLDLYEDWVRKWHYEPCEEVILPFTKHEVRCEVERRLQARYFELQQKVDRMWSAFINASTSSNP